MNAKELRSFSHCQILTYIASPDLSRKLQIKAVTSCSTHEIDQQETDG